MAISPFLDPIQINSNPMRVKIAWCSVKWNSAHAVELTGIGAQIGSLRAAA
jgi:hypothetical protein